MGIDIRLPIGLMFTIIGLLLAVFGLLSDTSIYQRSLGINVNLIWGGHQPTQNAAEPATTQTSVATTSSAEIASGHGIILTTTEPMRQVSHPALRCRNWPIFRSRMR